MNELDAFPKSRFLDVVQHGNALTFSLQRCFNQYLGLGLRRREVHRRVKSRLKVIGSATWLYAERVFIMTHHVVPIAGIAATLKDIDESLEAIAERPLTSDMVEKTLGIATKERSRWTKDGRLPSPGANTILRGHLIALSTYPVGEIERLIRDPLTIRTWRQADNDSTGKMKK